MGFSVTPSKPNRFQLEADTNDFVRLKEHFHGHTQSADNSLALSELPPNLRQFTHRNWTPNSGRNINLDSYINVVKEAIIGKSGNSIIYPNPTNNEQKALKEVVSRAGRNLIILPADKGRCRQRGRVVKAPDSLPTRSLFKTHLRHSVVSLGKILYGTFPCLVVLASSSKLHSYLY